MSSLALVSCLCGLLTSASAVAQEVLQSPERQDENKGSGSGYAAGVQERFLRVESRFLLHKLTQNGKVLDPGFFSIIPDSAVNGSPRAKEHLSRARLAHGGAFASAMITTGLLVGAEIIRQQHDGRWTRPSSAMALSGVLTLVWGFVFAHWRDWETFATVNSYNHDLVTGQLDH